MVAVGVAGFFFGFLRVRVAVGVTGFLRLLRVRVAVGVAGFLRLLSVRVAVGVAGLFRGFFMRVSAVRMIFRTDFAVAVGMAVRVARVRVVLRAARVRAGGGGVHLLLRGDGFLHGRLRLTLRHRLAVLLQHRRGVTGEEQRVVRIAHLSFCGDKLFFWREGLDEDDEVVLALWSSRKDKERLRRRTD